MAPRCSRPPSTIPAPTPLAILTNTTSDSPTAAPRLSSPSAPRLASLSATAGTPRRRSSSAPGERSRQPDRIPVRIRADRRSTGAGTHMPTAQSWSRAIPAARSVVRTMVAARSRVCGPCWSTSTGSRTSPSVVPLPSATTTCTWWWPTSTPATTPGGVARATSSGGRPLPPLCGRPRSVVATTTPDATRSLTRVLTVVRDRPVRRARSARLIGPPAASAAVMARRFCSRSRARDPEIAMLRERRAIRPGLALMIGRAALFPH